MTDHETRLAGRSRHGNLASDGALFACAAFLSILMAGYTSGVLGLVLSTGTVPLVPVIRPRTVFDWQSKIADGLGCVAVLIVIFAEIIPQAFCSRHGLW